MTQKRLDFFWRICAFYLYCRFVYKIILLPHCFYRTSTEQKKLFEAGKSQCDGYRKKSKHQLWRAIDFVIVQKVDGEWKCQWKSISVDQKYKKIGALWVRRFKGTWGEFFIP